MVIHGSGTVQYYISVGCQVIKLLNTGCTVYPFPDPSGSQSNSIWPTTIGAIENTILSSRVTTPWS
jgi:hypothetical protein